ncbi:MAG: YeeE/YedE family protein, partial [Desulfobulbaceae bacterium]|nr:YeeE/YedE family protein [Desulfobulbaceae bacterium]
MLRALLLLIVASMVLFEMFRQLGFLPLYPFPLLGSPSLANIVGGILFGIGMVTAAGCVVGTLYKMGGGSVISATA